MYKAICKTIFWVLIAVEILILMLEVYLTTPHKETSLPRHPKFLDINSIKRPLGKTNYNETRQNNVDLELGKSDTVFPQRLLMKTNEAPNISSDYLTCKDIQRMKVRDKLGRGTTKEVILGELDGREMAVKMVTSKVQDIKSCLNKRGWEQENECFLFANYKLMKEISLLMQLKHPNIIKLLGFCVRGESHSGSLQDQGVIAVTERGAKLNPYKMKKFSWPQRWQVLMDVIDLIVYCHNSPVGSILLGDFKMNQFVVIDDRIRLADLDDVTSIERPCTKNRDCYVLGERVGVECTEGTCVGINSKANILLATVELLMPLLESPPSYIATAVANFVGRMSRNEIPVARLIDEVEILRRKEENAFG